MEMVLKKGTAAIRAFFKRPHKHGQIVLCYIGLYTILQLQLVSARHHDLGKLLTVSSSSENTNFNEKELQQNTNAQINHSHENVEQSPIIKQQPILGQKITQQTPGSDIGPSGAVLSKDDGESLKFFSSTNAVTIFAQLSVCLLAVERSAPDADNFFFSLSYDFESLLLVAVYPTLYLFFSLYVQSTFINFL